MKKYNNSLVMAIIALVLLTGCNAVSSQFEGHFSQKVVGVEEPQTDDERTLVGEFNDYLALVDSLAEIWDGTDTLNMRRLMFEIGEQDNRIDKARRFQNVRRSMETHIKEQVNIIKEEIRQKFSKELSLNNS